MKLFIQNETLSLTPTTTEQTTKQAEVFLFVFHHKKQSAWY